jgi:hypothetical protein
VADERVATSSGAMRSSTSRQEPDNPALNRITYSLMRTLPSALLALTLLAATSTPQAQSPSATITAAQKNFTEFLELLRIPNVPAEPADMQRNAAFLAELFHKHGFDAQLLDNAAHRPLVFAALGKPRKGARTVLFYIHFDGQPVTPAEWSQKSPFEPVVKARDSGGKWIEVESARLTQQPFDPELRVFARPVAPLVRPTRVSPCSSPPGSPGPRTR